MMHANRGDLMLAKYKTVPISVTAMTPAQLQAQYVYDLTQLNTVAPSLQTESFSAAVGAQVFAVRGVGTLSFSSALESSVGLEIPGRDQPSYGRYVGIPRVTDYRTPTLVRDTGDQVQSSHRGSAEI